MKQQLLDLIEHTVFACDVEHVRICADGSAHIQSYRSDKEIVICGYFNTPPTWNYGISDKGELYSLLSNPDLSLDKQNGNLLTFKNVKTGNSIKYSFISEQRIAELVQFPTLKVDLDFDAIALLPDDFVEKLKLQAKIMNDEWFFEVESHLKFKIGDWSTGVVGNILLPAKYSYAGMWSWNINLLINILSQSGDYKLSISSKGYMEIRCKTNFAQYQYILPVLSK